MSTSEQDCVVVVPIKPTLVERAEYLKAPDKYLLLTDAQGAIGERLELLLALARATQASPCAAISNQEAETSEGVK